MLFGKSFGETQLENKRFSFLLYNMGRSWPVHKQPTTAPVLQMQLCKWLEMQMQMIGKIFIQIFVSVGVSWQTKSTKWDIYLQMVMSAGE